MSTPTPVIAAHLGDPIDVKCYLFKMYCFNVYGSCFWFDSSKAEMKKIDCLQL